MINILLSLSTALATVLADPNLAQWPQMITKMEQLHTSPMVTQKLRE